ncbi:MAG: CoA-binding protein [Rhizobiaceae bacterium]
MSDIQSRAGDRIGNFRALFEPKSIAVVGASGNGITAGNRYIRILQSQGFPGPIFPVHPRTATIEGLRAYPSIASLPETVDYAYLTIPAERVEGVLSQASGKLRFAQIMATAEPDKAKDWERRLVKLAQEGGFRIIGPNCMGTHSPRSKCTFIENVPTVCGDVGIACQSGGLGVDILRRGQELGLRYSGLVTLGNSVDVEPSDLLEFYLNDPQTKVIGLYVEDIKDGRRFQQLARERRGGKPVVALVGGLTKDGRKAASSHTGAMGASDVAWKALARQTGIILTQTLNEFLYALQVCSAFQPKDGSFPPRVTLFGNGGGTSVLATDAINRAGLELAVPNLEAASELGKIEMPPGASLSNPFDLPASVLKTDNGRIAKRILDIDRKYTNPYATIIHINLSVIMEYRHIPGFIENLIESILSGAPDNDSAPHKLLVIRSDRSEEADRWRRIIKDAAIVHRVPVFDEIPQAIQSLALYRLYETFRSNIADPS